MDNYVLNVISHHSDFDGKSLKKYHVDGIDTVGAYGDEPFSIVFKNNTSQDVQIKLSVDGTDVISGKLATTDALNDETMWFVNSYGSLVLAAWPETNNGGASFVFSSAKNSVAGNTHGDLSHRGIIAAAVYIEGDVKPINTLFTLTNRNILRSRSSTSNPTMYNNIVEISDLNTYNTNSTIPAASYDSMEELVAVGAGQYTEQKISYVQGLVKPIFTETVRVKYVWWDHLLEKLRTSNVSAPQASGFPADKKQVNIDLSNVPKINSDTKIGNLQRIEMPIFNRV